MLTNGLDDVRWWAQADMRKRWWSGDKRLRRTSILESRRVQINNLTNVKLLYADFLDAFIGWICRKFDIRKLQSQISRNSMAEFPRLLDCGCALNDEEKWMDPIREEDRDSNPRLTSKLTDAWKRKKKCSKNRANQLFWVERRLLIVSPDEEN